jgi:hypothetical protein
MINRRPGLLWVHVGIYESSDGILQVSVLSECLGAGVWLGTLGWRDFALDDIDCDQPTNKISRELILKWR